MSERSLLIEWIRGELVGPSRPLADATIIDFHDRDYTDPIPLRSGPLAWRPAPDSPAQEVLYYQRETPHRKYGAGVLHPGPQPVPPSDDEIAVEAQEAADASDTMGIEPDADLQNAAIDEEGTDADTADDSDLADASDDFEVTSLDIRHPSTIGISFCVRLQADDRILVRLPQTRRFLWQEETEPEFPLNGRYEHCTRHWTDDEGHAKDGPMWRRVAAVLPDTAIPINGNELVAGQVLHRNITMPEGSLLALCLDVFPRRVRNQPGIWLLTVVLRNTSQLAPGREREATLYQTYFEVVAERGQLQKYPESQRPFDQLDREEQSLSLLYRESATWAIGHGCAAGWDSEPLQSPTVLYADVMPAVQTPSMTPDIKDANGQPIQLSMRELAALPDDGQTAGWQTLTNVATEYGNWINGKRADLNGLPAHLRPVAERHLDAATDCLNRISGGIAILRSDDRARKAFRLANLAMLLQQIGTKQLIRRPLRWNQAAGFIAPEGAHDSPWNVYAQNRERTDKLGSWRAFQIAFLLMSLAGTCRDDSPDREIFDLIWFPTGGGRPKRTSR